MKKIIIAYASLSGNTEQMANLIAKGIQEEGCEVVIKEALLIPAKNLQKYDGILLGAYSWGGVPDDFIDFYNELADMNLSDKKAAAFGSGELVYREHFGIAVDLIEERLQKCGAEVIMDGLKINLAPKGNDIEKCIEFGRQFVRSIK